MLDETLRRPSTQELPYRSLIDKWGIKNLYPSIPGGREFYMPEIDIPPINSVSRVRDTEMVVRGARPASVNPNGIWYAMNGSPRLYVYKSEDMPPYTWDAHYWYNVEMTCYYHRFTRDDNVRGVHLAAIGFHEYGNSSAEVYYLSHLFEKERDHRVPPWGRFVLQKENEHGGGPGRGYSEPIEAQVPQMENERWYGFKLVVRTDATVTIEERPGPPGEGPIEVVITRPFTVLEGYRDDTDGQDGGNWRKVIEFKDEGNWIHPPNGRFRPYTYGHSCFVRADDVHDFLINRFSIRTISDRPWYIP